MMVFPRDEQGIPEIEEEDELGDEAVKGEEGRDSGGELGWAKRR